MQTIKLHEATRQFGISNRLAMFFLEKKNIPVKSHSSVISIDQLELLREFSGNQDAFKDMITEFNHLEKEKDKKPKVKDKFHHTQDETEKEKEPEKETEVATTPAAEIVPEPKPAQVEPEVKKIVEPASLPVLETKPPAEAHVSVEKPHEPVDVVIAEKNEIPIPSTQPIQKPSEHRTERVIINVNKEPIKQVPHSESKTREAESLPNESPVRERPRNFDNRERNRNFAQGEQREKPRVTPSSEQRERPRNFEQRDRQRDFRPGEQRDFRPGEQRDRQRDFKPGEQRDFRPGEQRERPKPGEQRDRQRDFRPGEQRERPKTFEQRDRPREFKPGDQRDRRPYESRERSRDFVPGDQKQRPRQQDDLHHKKPFQPSQTPPFRKDQESFKREDRKEFRDFKLPIIVDESLQGQFERKKKFEKHEILAKEKQDQRIEKLDKDFIEADMGDIRKENLKSRPVKKDKTKLKLKAKKEFSLYVEELEPISDDEPAIVLPAIPVEKVIKEPIPKKEKVEPKRVEVVVKEPPKPKEKVLNLPELVQTSNYINIKELAEKLNLKLKDIEEKMDAQGKEYLTNQILDIEDIKDICKEFNVVVDIISFEEDIFNNYVVKFKAEQTSRAPVVTVMGHVDHGKTTLLDTLRKTRVAEKEAGGITQKIGAYQLSFKGNDIVFIDTPGHEAFTNIRARGAKVTDIVVLVVAANDGVQPQTIEAINHARVANVPLIVAINKIDMDGADSTRVKQQLTKHEIVVEDWGGEVVSVEISAKHNKNLDALLEMINLVSEMLELKAFKNIPARGTIIESKLDPQLGPIGTVLLQHGQLKKGDFFICGNSVGKVKSIFDDHGKVLNGAQVPMPVEIMGFEEIPEAGELFQVTDDVEKARKVVEIRKQKGKEARIDNVFSDKKLSLQNLFDKLEEDKTKIFSIIIKTDNFSSCEVLEKILLKQGNDQLKINIVHKGVGNITESDILLASTSGAKIIAFNVKAPQKLTELARRENVEIKLYNVIYHLIEEVERALKGEIVPQYVETYIGKAEVLQIFKISKIGSIAGCLVREGKVTNKSKIKVLRKNDLVFEGDVQTLRRVKNEVSEVNAGTECGIRIKNFNAIEAGDILEIYELKLKT